MVGPYVPAFAAGTATASAAVITAKLPITRRFNDLKRLIDPLLCAGAAVGPIFAIGSHYAPTAKTVRDSKRSSTNPGASAGAQGKRTGATPTRDRTIPSGPRG
jgi:hypothetical protein